jgi:hypothetical protein
MFVLVACEFTGIVREAFTKRGHDAWSCDLIPSEIPGQHYIGDVRDILDNNWDLVIAHPPCKYLASTAQQWNLLNLDRQAKVEEALDFVKLFLECSVPRIAVENPAGIISTRIRKPDQILQPYNFGDDASKKTCLWLKGLPLLRQTELVHPRYVCCNRVLGYTAPCPICGGRNFERPRWANQRDNGNTLEPLSINRGKDRSRTYPGIADAMASQWGLLW